MLVTGAASECGLLLVALVLGWLTGVTPFAHYRSDLTAVAYGLVATLPLLLLLRWCLATGWPPIRRLVAMVREYLAPHLAGASVGGILLLSAMAGIGEEGLFRGVIQAGLDERWPAAAAVGTAALLFGAAHWLSTTYAVLAALVGAYLGVLFAITDNLLVPIVTHAAYDAVALMTLVRTRESR